MVVLVIDQHGDYGVFEAGEADQADHAVFALRKQNDCRSKKTECFSAGKAAASASATSPSRDENARKTRIKSVMKSRSLLSLLLFAFWLKINTVQAEPVHRPAELWADAWPQTDFSRSSVDFAEITSGGPQRDGIQALTDPQFVHLTEASDIPGDEPAIVIESTTPARAYPLRVLMWHELVNDVIDDRPVLVTYCPLCSAGVTFDRRVLIDDEERTLVFGVSGKLRRSNMIMYDRGTESWWQQYTGDAIVGELTGHELIRIPSQTIPLAEFAERHPDGVVLAAPDDEERHYGTNPYLRYDGETWPFHYDGRYSGPVPPLAYVVVIGNDAWPLERVKLQQIIRHGETLIEWHAGMSSALDDTEISAGRDIGFVEVVQFIGDRTQTIPHEVTFAFAFKAFVPEGVIHVK